MKIRLLLSLMILTCFLINLAASERLGMFVEVKRYLNEQKNTKYDIDYQVPYKNLTFLTRDKSFFAELQVTLTISNADSVLVTRQFTNNIGVTQKYDITTSSKSYLDRISLTLAKPGYRLGFRFEDINTGKSYDWTYETRQLDRDEKLSDMELVTLVTPDSVSHPRKFMRHNLIYIPESSGLVSRELHDSIYFYCEAYDIRSEKAKAVLTVLQDSIPVFIKTYIIDKPTPRLELIYPVGITALNVGTYLAFVELIDDETTYSRYYELIITEQTEQMYFIFTDLEDEYQLIRYLANPKSSSNWRTMSKEAKRRYISGFWTGMAGMNNEPVDILMKKYRDRIDYCNARYSHFEQGWKSDLGRIYIRNGPPSDEVSDMESTS